jgi:hypothetical protein
LLLIHLERRDVSARIHHGLLPMLPLSLQPLLARLIAGFLVSHEDQKRAFRKALQIHIL